MANQAIDSRKFRMFIFSFYNIALSTPWWNLTYMEFVGVSITVMQILISGKCFYILRILPESSYSADIDLSFCIRISLLLTSNQTMGIQFSLGLEICSKHRESRRISRRHLVLSRTKSLISTQMRLILKCVYTYTAVNKPLLLSVISLCFFGLLCMSWSEMILLLVYCLMPPWNPQWPEDRDLVYLIFAVSRRVPDIQAFKGNLTNYLSG